MKGFSKLLANNLVKKWVHPRTNEVRYYLDLRDTGLLDLDYYKTGSIRSASFDDEDISNSCAYRLKASKIWFSSEGVLHIQSSEEDRIKKALEKFIKRY